MCSTWISDGTNPTILLMLSLRIAAWAEWQLHYLWKLIKLICLLYFWHYEKIFLPCTIFLSRANWQLNPPNRSYEFDYENVWISESLILSLWKRCLLKCIQHYSSAHWSDSVRLLLNRCDILLNNHRGSKLVCTTAKWIICSWYQRILNSATLGRHWDQP